MNRTITAVPGVLAGHASCAGGASGVTAVLFPGGAVGGVWIPGSATGSRELGVLDPSHLAGAIHGICLSGGSAFGLGAADGVMAELVARGVGFDTGHGRVPIVPSAILFDLDAGAERPGPVQGRAAAAAASGEPLASGRVGAGAGARVARGSAKPLPGGVGGWSEAVDGHRVGALAVVNAVGAIRDPEDGRWVAGVPDVNLHLDEGDWRKHTTLVVVATDAPIGRPGCTIVARMASAGLARAIWPAFTPFDGDVVFSVSTGSGPSVDSGRLMRLGDAAATAVGRAVVRAVSP